MRVSVCMYVCVHIYILFLPAHSAFPQLTQTTLPPPTTTGASGCLERGVFAEEMKLHALRPRGLTTATIAMGKPAGGVGAQKGRELLVLEPGGDINQVCLFVCGGEGGVA